MRHIWIFFIITTVHAGSLDSINYMRDIYIQVDFYKKYTQPENLQKNAAIYIKNYGDGQLSSFSYRGFTAQQTQIRWNQVDISSPFLGQIDLSTIPYSLEFKSSSPSSIGGILDINTSPNIKAQTQKHLFELKWRSQNMYHGQYNYAIQKDKRSLMIDFDVKKGNNNFRYNNQNVEAEQIHNALEQIAFILDHRWEKKLQHQFSLWQTNTQREIAPTMSSKISHAQQRDHSMRALYGFENRNNMANKTVFMVDNLIFRDSAAAIESRSANYSMRNSMQKKWTKFHLPIKLILETNADMLVTNNYSDSKYMFKQYTEISSNIRFRRAPLHLKYGISHTFQNDQFAYPLPFASIAAEMIQKPSIEFNTELFAKIQTRFPTGNDWYWHLGGNPQLRPEYAYQVDWKNNIKTNHLHFLINPFVYYTQDLIQWTPTDKGYWQVENLHSVWSKGIHIEAALDFKHIHLQSHYQYISSTSGQHQIIYVPEHKSTNFIQLNFDFFSTQLDYSFTSERYFTTDNSQFLPSYSMVDWSIQKNISIAQWHSNIKFSIRNLLNEDYSEVVNRPMPLRMFELTYRLSWTKNKTS
ncbi:MAG: hypothetical protein KA797_05315 [Chitinophagales bacterium]|nr:hypothetical protein [Chitinophagales bacterium]